jgi:ubiquinone/menaquinone biosynthesis C-methylase UbiE
MESSRTFLPAAGADWLLPLYDPFVKLFGIGNARNVLLAQADLKPGHRVLDIGCGTGTFAVQIKQKYPNVEVTGLDPDPKALARAEQKAKQAAVAVKFDKGFSDELHYPYGSSIGFARPLCFIICHRTLRKRR